MTLLAGIWSAGREPLPVALTAPLVRALSRHPDDVPWVHEVPGCLLAKVDIGVFGERAAFAELDGAATALAGEPLIDRGDGTVWRGRDDDTAHLHRALRDADWAVLARCRGSYCLAHYDPAAHALALATDQLGIRCLYQARLGPYVVFASALRVLEGVPGLELRLDARAATERIFLQAPLGGRSHFRDVHLLVAGEAVEHRSSGQVSRITRRWDRVPRRFTSEREAIDAVDTAFHAAVARRRRDDRATTSLLSGGLDSRVIVAALRMGGMRVRTLNFSLSGSLDEAIGALYARAAGAIHESRPYQAGLDDSYEEMAARSLAALPAEWPAPERPGLLWSGFGGSGFLGQINTKPAYTALCRAGDLAGAVEAFLELKGTRVPGRLFTKPFSEPLARVTREGVLAEVTRLAPDDPGRLMDLFLLLNASRCQLHAPHEQVDLLRIEQQTPFFDAELVDIALGIPFDWLAGHRFYHRWLERFGPPVTTTPWQAYPGHEPCPLPMPAGARPQWELARARRFRRHALLRSALSLLRGPIPADLLDRRYLAAVSLAHWLGLRDYAYAIRAARRYAEWWERGGRRPIPPVQSISGTT